MKLTFLGTGTSQGVPVIACPCEVCHSSDSKDKRLRTSALIEFENQVITIDAGPDFRQQMLKYNVLKLDAILLTHAHFDHIGGLDDVRSYNYLQNSPMDIYGNAEALADLQKTFAYAFANLTYPGLPEYNLHYIDEKPFYIGNQEIIPIKAFHHLLPVLGYRINDLVYMTDIKRIEPKELDKMRGVKILIVNALHKQKHFSHFNLSEALSFVEQVQPAQAYFTHISHWMGKHEEVSEELPQNVHLAYDGLELIF